MADRPAQVILRRAPSGGYNAPEGASRWLGGQFIPKALWDAEKEAAKRDMLALTERFESQMVYLADVYRMTVDAKANVYGQRNPLVVTVTRTKDQMEKAILNAYEQAVVLGRRAHGNLSETSSGTGQIGRLRDMLASEYHYLAKFCRDMDTHTGTMNYNTRADYYGKAVREAYWLGFACADPTRHVFWMLGPTEHCDDCTGMAERGVMTVPDLLATGLLPQSGSLACLGYHCQCSLHNV